MYPGVEIHQTTENRISNPNNQRTITITMTVTPVTVSPIAVPEGSGINFGATISGVDIETISGKFR